MPISLIKEEETHILRVLPILLKKDEQFRGSLYAILSETFATKDDFTRVLEEIRLLREETNKRFEETNKRFEAIDRRFEELIKEMHYGFELQSKATRDLKITVDTIGARWGICAEKTLRNTLKELLLKNLKVTEVKELKIKDKDGYVFGYPEEVQIDLLIKDGEDYLVEISSSAGSSDVTILSRKAKLYERETNKKAKPVFVCVDMKDKGKDACKELGIQLITYEEIKE
ncbi:MAG: DUF3782 domain-containing protein [bacterium]